jgi:cystathionine beta-lyase family protein involved in aluminum resistance
MTGISKEVRLMAEEAESSLAGVFNSINKTAERNTERVMAAFRRHSVSDTMFAGTTGYGYNDRGRDTLDQIYADVMGCEAGLVRLGFVNGTHAISSGLFAALRPGQVLLMANGTPYDTIHGPIGLRGDYHGSLKFYGIGYRQVDLLEDGTPDVEGVAKAAASPDVGAVLIQRSCGYSVRPSLSVVQIKELCRAIRGVSDAVIVVDNCYGEFAEAEEPGGVDGGDLLCGSLIKNPGGGIAESGGYVVGREDLVEKAAFRLTVPGIGGECGSTFGQNRLLYQGLFLAPHIVANSLKTAVFCAKIMEMAGYKCSPGWDEERHDIIQRIEFGDPQQVRVFCEGIQEASPVDSFVTPVPAPMPGYDCDIIMAAGTFIQGASIELSCDAPMRPPYVAFLQGGLTYESSKLGVMNALGRVLSLK